METEQLAIVYRKLATEMGFEEYHMYMRYVQLDFAKRKEDAGQPPPLFVSDIGPDDIQIDRYIPSQLCLAINELDESQIGKFSFRGKEALSQVNYVSIESNKNNIISFYFGCLIVDSETGRC